MSESPIVQMNIQARPLARSSLEDFLQSDAALFPSCLTLPTLQSWYDTNPTNFLSHRIYDESTGKYLSEENLGTLIAFAMKAKPWKKLISGQLEEHMITSEMILQESYSSWSIEDREQGYGMHIWHIEKSKLWNQFYSKSFKEVFWSDLQRSVSLLSSQRMKCIGFSALCATEEGTRAISSLGFQCVGHFDVTVQHRDGRLKIIHSTESHSESSKDEDEWKTISKCGMYVKRI